MRDETFMNKIMKDSIEYDNEIQLMAKRLSWGDTFLADDLRSEMHIAIMNMEVGKPKRIYLQAAKYKAIDYIRSRARNYSYGGVIKHFSIDALIEAGFQIDLDKNLYSPNDDFSIHAGHISDPE